MDAQMGRLTNGQSDRQWRGDPCVNMLIQATQECYMTLEKNCYKIYDVSIAYISIQPCLTKGV